MSPTRYKGNDRYLFLGSLKRSPVYDFGVSFGSEKKVSFSQIVDVCEKVIKYSRDPRIVSMLAIKSPKNSLSFYVKKKDFKDFENKKSFHLYVETSFEEEEMLDFLTFFIGKAK